MYKRRNPRKILRRLFLAAMAGHGAAASAQTVVNLPAVDSGIYMDNGQSDASREGYTAGQFNVSSDVFYSAGLHTVRNWFVFDLASINRPVTAATLNLFNPAGGYVSGDSGETLSFFDVSTSISSLRAGGSGQTAIYNDLGGGLLFGSKGVAAPDNNSTIPFVLNSNAWGDINAHGGSLFAIGGALTTVSGSSQQVIFNGTSSSNSRSLSLTLADSIQWQNASGGSWQTPGNWQYSFVPTAATDATFNLNNTYTVTIPASSTARSLNVTAGTVTFNMSGGGSLAIAGPTPITDRVNIATEAGQTATLIVNGGTMTIESDRLSIGRTGTGTLQVKGGALVRMNAAASEVNVGGGGLGGGTGVLIVDGTGSKVKSFAEFTVGGKSNGSVLLINGGAIESGNVVISPGAAGFTARATVGGTGTGSWTAPDFDIGAYHDGSNSTFAATLDIHSGGNVSIAGTTKVWNNISGINISNGTLTTGSLRMDAGTLSINNGLLSSLGEARFGITSTANAFVTNGGVASFGSNTYVGISGASGSLTIDGAGTGATYIGGGFNAVGGGGFGGTFIVRNGGAATFNGNVRVVGVNGSNPAGSAGTVLLESGGSLHAVDMNLGADGAVSVSGRAIVDGSSLDLTGNLIVNGSLATQANGAATFTVLNNGSVNVAGTSKVWNGGTILLNSGTLATGTLDTLGTGSRLNWTGGTLEINNSDTTIGTGAAVGTILTLSSGKHFRVIDTTGGAVTGLLAVPSTGTLSVSGGSLYARSLDLGNAGSFSFTGGSITVNGGAMTPKLSTISVNLAPVASNVANSMEVNGVSTATLTLQAGGTLSSSASNLFLGHSGKSGFMSIDGATSSLSLTAGLFEIGTGRDTTGTTAGVGTLSVTNGAQATSSSIAVIGFSGGKGQASIDGASSKLASSGNSIRVGETGFFAGSTFYASEGTLNLTNGGQATYFFSPAIIGFGGGKGYVSVDGINSKLAGTSAALRVGYTSSAIGSTFYASEGTLSLTNSGQASSNSGTDVGYFGGKGFASVAGGTLTVGQLLNIGSGTTDVSGTTYRGTGTLIVTSGGSVTSNRAAIGGAGGIGKVTLSDAGSVWANAATLSLGNDGTGSAPGLGTGTLLVSNNSLLDNGGVVKVYPGGTLIVSGGKITTHDLDLGSAGSFSFTGGTITVNGGRLTPRPSPNVAFSPSNFTISGSGSPLLKLTGGGTVSSALNDLVVGIAGESGALTIDGNNSEYALLTGGMYLGSERDPSGAAASMGTLTVTNGGRATSPSIARIGYFGGKGYATVDGANSSLAMDEGLLFVGSYGALYGSTYYPSEGTLQLSNAAQATGNSHAYIGSNGGKGYASVDGANTILENSTGGILVGESGLISGSTFYASEGTLSLTNGGLASAITNGYIGSYGGKGYVQNIGGALDTGFTLHVGYGTQLVSATTYRGTGTLVASGGGSISSDSALIGANGGVGTVNLTGAGTGWSNATDLHIGNDGSGNASANGTGTLAILNNASLTNGGMLKVYSAGTLIVNGGSLTTHDLDVSNVSNAFSFAFSDGTITIDGGAMTPRLQTASTWTALYGLGISTPMGFEINSSVGGPAVSHLRLVNGATLSASASALIGNSGRAGDLTVDGAGSSLNLPGGDLLIGTGRDVTNTISGVGTLTVSNAGAVNSNRGIIGYRAGLGTVILTGTNSGWNNTGGLYVGNDSAGNAATNGTGYLSITDNAILSNAGMLRVYSGGSLSMSGGALTTHDLDLGSAGSFSFTGGAITVDGGAMTPKLSAVNVAFSLSPANFPNSMEISGSSTPTLALQAGGTLASSSSNFFLGHSGKSGLLSIDGATTSMSLTTGQLYVGGGRDAAGTTSGTGTLNLSNGGQAIISSYAYIGAAGGQGYASVDGAYSKLGTVGGELHIGVSGFYSGSTSYSYFGEGTLSLTNGGQASSGSTTFVGSNGGRGWATVDGPNSKLASTSRELHIGDYGTNTGLTFYASEGTLIVMNGGQAASSTHTNIGYYGGKGYASVAGGTLSVGQHLNVGYGSTVVSAISYRGVGSLAVTGGGSVTSNLAVIGAYGGIGTVSLSGAGTGWANTTNLYVGNDGSGSPSADGTGTLSISNNAALTNGQTLKVYSGGTLLFNGGTLRTGSLVVPGGHVRLSPGHDKVIQTGSLSISAGGVIDLNDNYMIIDYAALGNLPNEVLGYLQSGALISSAANTTLGLGYADNSTLGYTSFAGVTGLTGTELLVKYTYYGDANLDGIVNVLDMYNLSQSWQSAGTWINGDFNYDGFVDASDLGLVGLNWLSGMDGPLSEVFPHILEETTSVPEPAYLSLLLVSIAMSCRRRRRLN